MKKLILLLTIFSAFLALSACSDECRHYNMKDTAFEPDCSLAGYTLSECVDCGYSYKCDFLAPTGHTLNSNEVPPTCEAAGYTEYLCECGFSYKSDYLPSRPHVFLESKVEPTCKSEGYTEYLCDCGFSYRSGHVAPLPHTLTEKKTEPTCTLEGYTRYTCECSYTYDSDRVAPIGHTFASVKREASCTELGYTEYSCIRCAEKYNADYIAPKGHDFSATLTHPTYISTGYTRYTCKCGFSYNGSFVMSSDIYKGAYVDSDTPLAKGVDLSKWNGNVDFSELKKLEIDFVILKAGSTKSGLDPYFEANYKSAKAAGIDVGAYFYTYSTTGAGALEDAERCIAILEGKQLEYPIYFDLEDESLEGLSVDILTEMCEVFIKKMQQNGYFCGLYVNDDWLIKRLHTEKVTTYFDVWYARWTASGEPEWKESFGQKTGLWQYTDGGSLEGITGRFDLNIAYKDYPAIIKEYHLNGF